MKPVWGNGMNHLDFHADAVVGVPAAMKPVWGNGMNSWRDLMPLSCADVAYRERWWAASVTNALCAVFKDRRACPPAGERSRWRRGPDERSSDHDRPGGWQVARHAVNLHRRRRPNGPEVDADH